MRGYAAAGAASAVAAAASVSDPSSHGTRVSPCSLPPRVRGSPRGVLHLSVDGVSYYAHSRSFAPAPQRRGGGGATTNPPPGSQGAQGLEQGTTLLRLAWWGEQGSGTVWRPDVSALDTEGTPLSFSASRSKAAASAPPRNSTGIRELEHAAPSLSSTVQFPIVVSGASFCSYLHDAQWLVLELHHFLETDAQALQRDFLKALSRAAHANRAFPQQASSGLKPPLAHVMLDLAPMAEALSAGAGSFSQAKNLPILLQGVPVGHVAVRVHVHLDGVDEARAEAEALAALDAADAVDEHDFTGGQQLSGPPSSTAFGRPLSGGNGGAGGGPHVSFDPSSRSTIGGAGVAGGGGANAAPSTMPVMDRFEVDLAALIRQAESEARSIEDSVNGVGRKTNGLDAIGGGQQQQQQQHQPLQGPPRARDAPSPPASKWHEDDEHTHERELDLGSSPMPPPPQPTRTRIPLQSQPHATQSASSRFGAAVALPSQSYPHPLSSSIPASSSASGAAGAARPFSAPPPFADFTPAPPHFFGLAALGDLPPAPVGPTLPPFAESLPGGRPPTTATDPRSCLDQGGMVSLWIRFRKVQFEAKHLQQLHPASSSAAPAVKHHHQPTPSSVVSRDRPGNFLVLHFQLFPDLAMARSSPVSVAPGVANVLLGNTSAPSSSSSVAAATSHSFLLAGGDSVPRVYSASFLSSLSRATVPLEVLLYKSRPSWRDRRDESTGRFVPAAPAQTVLGRAEVSLSSLASLPLSQPPVGSHLLPPGLARSSELVGFLRSHTSFSGRVTLLDPSNSLPSPLGSLELSLGWGSAKDVARINALEVAATVAQRVVRGFLARRRSRRARIARERMRLEQQQLEQEEEEEDEEEQQGDLDDELHMHQQQQQLHPPHHGLASSRSSLAPSATASPRGMIPTARSLQFKDQASSPMARSTGFKLNLPPQSPTLTGTATRKEMATSPLPSARKSSMYASPRSQPKHASPLPPPPSSQFSASVGAPFASSSSLFNKPREAERKEFVSYAFTSQRGAARQQHQHDRLADSFALIQQTREQLAATAAAAAARDAGKDERDANASAAAQAAGSSVPATPSTRRTGLTSPPLSTVSKQQHTPASEQHVRSPNFFVSSPPPPPLPATTSPLLRTPTAPFPSSLRASVSPVRITPLKQASPSVTASASASKAAAAPSSALSPTSSRAALGLEEFSDVEVDEDEEEDVDDEEEAYDDEEFTSGGDSDAEDRDRDAIKQPAPSTATVAAVRPLLPITQPSPPSLSAGGVHLDGDDESARMRLRQQMAELDELQRRLRDRLEGNAFQSLSPSQSKQQQQQQEMEEEKKQVQQQQPQHQTPQRAAVQPEAHFSVSLSAAAGSSVSPPPSATLQQFQRPGSAGSSPSFLDYARSPMHLGQQQQQSQFASPGADTRSHPHYPPATPSTPASFLGSVGSPLSDSIKHYHPAPSPSATPVSLFAANQRATAPSGASTCEARRPSIPSAADVVAAMTSSPPAPLAVVTAPVFGDEALPGPSNLGLAREASIPEVLSVQPPPAGQEASPSPLLAAQSPLPQQQQQPQQKSPSPLAAGVASVRSPPVNQWLARGHLSPSHIARSPDHEDDESFDRSSSQQHEHEHGHEHEHDDDDDDDVSSGEEESEGDEAPEWDVRVTGTQNVRVAVQYERAPVASSAAAAAMSSSSASRGERERLYPHGLHGSSSHINEPGASGAPFSYHHPLSHSGGLPRPPQPSSGAGSAASSRWDSNFQPSEEDARRMERIARIMKQHEHEHEA